MKKSLILISALSGAVLFSGCATMFGGGGMQNITLESDEPLSGKIAYEDGKGLEQKFTTPATLTIERRKQDLIVTSNDGSFEDKTIKRSMNGWVWGDIIATSPLSTTVDMVTGAAWKYDDVVKIDKQSESN